MTYGNGLNDWNTFTLDHEMDVRIELGQLH
jgi:hypothetical protein